MIRRLALTVALGLSPLAAAAQSSDIKPLTESLIFGRVTEADRAARELGEVGDQSAIAGLIFGLRFAGTVSPSIQRSLRTLTGDEDRGGWFEWMLWQEANPQVRPDPGYLEIKRRTYAQIDPNFDRFLKPEHLDDAKIRIEEVAWGGVRVDGIPSLDDPETIPAADADYLRDEDLVFGISINGDAQAWPLRILGWHEMSNGVVGGVPLALAYCTLCGAGIAFETDVEGRDEPFIFSTSGFLYRSNKLMYDRQTDTLWNQFTGKPVYGPLVGSDITLKMRPITVTNWGEWKAANPETRVLSLETGHTRDYSPGAVYNAYFSSPDLMFPAIVDESRYAQKSYVFGVQAPGAARAWPLEHFEDGAVINDAVGTKSIVLIGDAASRTVRAYDRGDRVFEQTDDGGLRDASGEWRMTEDALVGPDGATAPRVPGHISYWFAWNSFIGVDSTLYEPS